MDPRGLRSPCSRPAGPLTETVWHTSPGRRLDAVVGYEAISVAGKLAWYEQPSTAISGWIEHVISQSAWAP